MARGKATIALDREKVARVQAVIGAHTMSAAIDVALDRLLEAEDLARDVAAYRQVPVTGDELRIADLPVDFDLDDDDTDYEALYGRGT